MSTNTSNGSLSVFDSYSGTGRIFDNELNLLTHFSYEGTPTNNAFYISEEEILLVGCGIHIFKLQLSSYVEIYTLDSCAMVSIMSYDERYLALGDVNGNLYIFDIQSNSVIHKWTAHASEITTLAWGNDSDQVFTGGLDGFVRLWNITSQTEVSHLNVFDRVYDMSFNPVENSLAIAGNTDCIVVWELPEPSTYECIDVDTQNSLIGGVSSVSWNSSFDRLAFIRYQDLGIVVAEEISITLEYLRENVSQILWANVRQLIIVDTDGLVERIQID